MELSYNYITGQPSAVAQSIARSLGQYERQFGHVKVGITSDPVRRAREHQVAGWRRMVVKYKTSSERNANLVEKYFIVHRQELTNEWPGYSPLPQPGPFYVYLLMK